MKPAMFCLYFLISISPLYGYRSMFTYDNVLEQRLVIEATKELTPMEALDYVKQLYAANFEKHKVGEWGTYYYKLPLTEYYLVYEGKGETDQQYLFHLYEFVIDEPEEGIGHTVTYGWYQVNKVTGAIIEVR